MESRVAAIMTSEGFQESTEGAAESLVGVVLESTPFYAEQGGQVADTGRITSTSDLGYMEVQDTQVVPSTPPPSLSPLFLLQDVTSGQV